MKLTTRRVVVTGAASGLGQRVAELLKAGGSEVVGLDLRRPVGVVDEYIECDLADRSSIDAVIRSLPGEWDALCNVAGVPGTLPGDVVIKVNFLGLRHLTESMLDRISDGGAVVNVASTAGNHWRKHLDVIQRFISTRTFEEGASWWEAEGRDLPAYNFSKEAVIVYAMLASRRAWDRGVRVNTVSPGVIRTPLLPAFEASMGKEKLESVRHFVGRHAEPDDIAPAIVFLASADAAWVNGLNFIIDGGLTAAQTVGLFPVSPTARATGSSRGAGAPESAIAPP